MMYSQLVSRSAYLVILHVPLATAAGSDQNSAEGTEIPRTYRRLAESTSPNPKSCFAYKAQTFGAFRHLFHVLELDEM